MRESCPEHWKESKNDNHWKRQVKEQYIQAVPASFNAFENVDYHKYVNDEQHRILIASLPKIELQE